jgi:hypothetical protein
LTPLEIFLLTAFIVLGPCAVHAAYTKGRHDQALRDQRQHALAYEMSLKLKQKWN